MAGIPQQQLDKLAHIDSDVHTILENMGQGGGGSPPWAEIIGAIAAGFAAVVAAIEAGDAAIVAAIGETNGLLTDANAKLDILIGFQTPEPEPLATDLGLAGGTIVEKPPEP